jgi:hypothetical protein
VKGEFTLPLGQYRVYGWDIERKDNKGARWTVSGYNFGEAADFEVAAEKQAVLEMGEPLRAVFQAFQQTNNQVAFRLRFRGRFDESIEIQREGQRPRGPLLTLVNPNGTFRFTNSFEFG